MIERKLYRCPVCTKKFWFSADILPAKRINVEFISKEEEIAELLRGKREAQTLLCSLECLINGGGSNV